MTVHAKDIAKKLGLSPAAISLVLRGKPGVSDETRQLVLQTAEEMGFHRKMEYTEARKRILFVCYKKHGSVVGDTEFFSQLSQNVDMEAKRLGYECTMTYFYESQNTEEQINNLKRDNCAGLLLLATEMHTADLAPFKKLPMPIVILDSYFPDEDFDCILINNVYGAKHAVQYLISCGHSEIGYLSSSVVIRNFRERLDGYQRGIKTISVLNDSRRHIIKVRPTSDGAYDDMMAFLSSTSSLPTAFFADNDLIAISCIRALNTMGYSVPDDVSVIGFDGIYAGECMIPGLTTMDVSKREMGTAAVNRLDERIRGICDGFIKVEVATSLVIRGTVKDIH